jgi:predicted SAM-dependent methyltransferase
VSLSIIVPICNGHTMGRAALEFLQTAITEPNTEIIALDNGSESHFTVDECRCTRVVRLEENVGLYPIFAMAPSFCSPQCDLIGVLHSDLLVYERGFDARLRAAFASRPSLGLVGFVGSNEIDQAGGRGLGTALNFEGRSIDFDGQNWTGTPAARHGRQLCGLERAAVVDGCAMVFRRAVLESVPPRPGFPPHHFYDRLLSCQVIESGWDVGVLGIACDHISAQTANPRSGYFELAKQWCLAHRGITESSNWDLELYRAAEEMWLGEYRETKRMVPMCVDRHWPEATQRGLRVNLGCETYHFPGFLNIDIRRGGEIRPEIMANACQLPFRDRSCAFLYAGHFLEHLYIDDVPQFLEACWRALSDTGTLVVVVPDVGTSMKRYARGEYTLDHILPQVFGNYHSHDPEPQRHRYMYDAARLHEVVRSVPWTRISRLDYAHPPVEIRPLLGREIVLADWQMGIVLVK